MKLVLSALTTALLMSSTFANAAPFKLDAAHSGVGFTVKHLVIFKVKGEFKKVEGTFDFDEATMTVDKVKAVVDAGSINTNEPDRDKHLKSPDFFDVAKTPNLTFTADKFTVAAGKAVSVDGKLTMKGIEKPVKLDVTYAGKTKDPWGNERIGFNITGKIKRSDWGMTWNKALEAGGVTVGDEIEIAIDGEAMMDAPKAPKAKKEEKKK